MEYKSSNIAYTKANDQETQRVIYIKETSLIFQIIDYTKISGVDKSVAYFEGDFNIVYNNGTGYNESILIESCQLGKNIDMKYQEYFNQNNKFTPILGDLYCLNLNSNILSLFYQPNIGSSSLNIHIVMNKSSIYAPEQLLTLILSENDLINHNNKENPITKNYIFQFIGGYSSYEYSTINFNFQYIKYESDDGLFFENRKLFNGISFSDIVSFRNIQKDYNLEENFKKYNHSRIGTISFSINMSNYDHYKRTYQKMQSLLAEIMSVISLFFEIGRQVIDILIRKKMSINILDNIINNNKKIKLQNKIIKIDKSFTSIKKNNISSSDRKDIFPKIIDKTNNINHLENNNRLKLVHIKRNNELMNYTKIYLAFSNNTDKLKKINYFNIIKSYFCFKDEKSKIINLFHNIVNEDMSVEKIMERFYKFENAYIYFSNKQKKKKKYKEKNEKVLKDCDDSKIRAKTENLKNNCKYKENIQTLENN